MSDVLEKVYEPERVEQQMLAMWESHEAFRARPDERGRDRRFVVMIPLPNVTGSLHLGHAINNTLQDVMTRWHRMRGFNSLYQPGTDHAGIATQAVVEKRIHAEEGKTRHDLGREELVGRIWDWKKDYEARILNQLKMMGCSCDWGRVRFTLDDGYTESVYETFFRWFSAGLIYRGERLVNWDTELRTAVADDEVYHETVKGHFWHFKYPIQDPPPGGPTHLGFATTRPETMLGDVALAVHPDDARYKDLVGRSVLVPLFDPPREIPILADAWADPEKGTGCVKITPAHDPNDYQVGLRHGLPMINIMTPDRTVSDQGGGYAGMTFAEARKAVTEKMDALGLLDKVDDIDVDLPHSDRSKAPIEPFLSPQWFVRMGDIVPNEPRTSVRADADHTKDVSYRATPDLSQGAVLLTWTTYGSWLPGDERGFVSRVPLPEGGHTIHNVPGEPYDADDPQVRNEAIERMAGEPVRLTAEQAGVLLGSIAGSAERHAIELLAVAIMSDHIHVLCQTDRTGSELLKLFKGAGSRDLNVRFHLRDAPRWFTRRGSARVIKKNTDLTAAVEYVRRQARPLYTWVFDDNEGAGADVVESARTEVRGSGAPWASARTGQRESVEDRASARTGQRESVEDRASARTGQRESVEDRASARTEVRGSGGVVLADGSVVSGLAQAAIDAVEDGRVRIFPERYTKTYIDWLSEKRDWCISRQLWWGHRIPVWTAKFAQRALGVLDSATAIRKKTAELCGKLQIALDEFGIAAGCESHFCVRADVEGSSARCFICVRSQVARDNLVAIANSLGGARHVALGDTDPPAPVILSNDPRYNALSAIKELVGELEQDPDVLDTWFSSQLWPYATLGWPTRGGSRGLASSGEGSPRTLSARAGQRESVEDRASARTGQRESVEDRASARTGQRESVEDRASARTGQRESVEDRASARAGQRESVEDRASARTEVRGSGWEGTAETDVDYYYPGTVLITSRDIISLWVARMVLSGLYNLGQVPFKHVYIHPKILDGRGETMSKSKGNGVDPIDIIKMYGADAMRYSLADMTTETQDVRMPVEYRCPHCAALTAQTARNMNAKTIECKACKKTYATRWADAPTVAAHGLAQIVSDKFEIGRNFCNKLWNAARFAFMNLEGVGCETIDVGSLPTEDRWILARLSQTIRQVNEGLGRYRFSASVKALRDFFWDALCDWYIELTKGRLRGGHGGDEAKQVLAFCLDQVLRLLHPFTPFVTERLWGQLNAVAPRRGLPGAAQPETNALLILAEYPPAAGWSALNDDEIVSTFAALQSVTRAVRDLRQKNNVPPKQTVTVTIRTPPEQSASLREQAGVIRQLANVGELHVATDAARPANSGTVVLGALQVFVHGVSDDAAERRRLEQTLADVDRQISGKEKKLANENFVKNAKPEIVQAERDRLAALFERRSKLGESLELLR